jgi:hypothetical protein
LKFLTVQVAANENQSILALLTRRPRAISPAFEEHVHRLENESHVASVNIQNTLGAKNILAACRQELSQPRGKRNPIDGARQANSN